MREYMAVYKSSTFWILCCCLGVVPGIIYYALAEKPKNIIYSPQPIQQQVVITQQPIFQPEVQKKPEAFCPNCGSGIDKGVTFCPNCGTKLAD